MILFMVKLWNERNGQRDEAHYLVYAHNHQEARARVLEQTGGVYKNMETQVVLFTGGVAITYQNVFKTA